MSAFYDQASLVVVPSGYKSGKIYAQKPLTTDGQLTFTRASTATRVNASGLIESVASGVPRLDYQGSTCPKLLLEKQSTNYFTDSSALPGTGWTSAGATFTTGQADPSGGTGGLRVQFAAGSSFFLRLFGYAAGISYARSVYMKASTPQTIRFEDPITGFGVTANLTSSWQRFSFAQVVSIGMGVQFANSIDNAAKDFIVAFPQIEESAYATSYIPTTSAAVTRLADSGTTSIPSLVNASEGVLFLDYQPLNVSDAYPVDFQLQYNGSNSANGVTIYHDSATPSIAVRSGSSLIFGASLTATTAGTRNKIAIAYKGSDFAVYQNGVLKASQSSGAAPANLNEIRLSDGTRHFSINQALVFKTRLTNAQLAELTTL
jgi:hypothetical protein